MYPWPPILGLRKSAVVAPTCLRCNRVQVEIAETYGVSQSAISPAITGLTPLITAVLDELVPTAEELDPQSQYIVDRTSLKESID